MIAHDVINADGLPAVILIARNINANTVNEGDDMDNNILVQYDGGGWDGCIWEWNFFFIDKNGIFHDIYSSGCAGIETATVAYGLFDNSTKRNKVYVYHLDKEDELKDFATETHGSLVESVVRWFNNYNDPDAEPFATCNECGGYILNANEIHIVNAETICYECYGCRTCECCDSYVGSDNIIYTGTYAAEDDCENKAAEKLESGGYQYICEYCLEYRAVEIEQGERQDLLHESLCTGKPDIFSDEMKWYWNG